MPLRTVKKLDRWLHQHIPLLFLLTLLVLLRIPNLFEPYWYGDEGIYLTVGNALRHGEHLYAQIIDHKTPLIYYLAMVPRQIHFRLLLIGWMIAATVTFNHLVKQLFRSRWAAVVASLAFVLLTTLPWFEGNIPNGELFVMGFVLVGTYFWTKTQWFAVFFKDTGSEKLTNTTGRDQRLLVLTGGLLGLGILTKVPALFDAAALFAMAWYWWVETNFKAGKVPRRLDLRVLPYLALVGVGVLIPIVLSILYFVARGSGSAYLDFGLLYNFRYAGNWELPFSGPLTLLFTLPGKLIVLALGGLALTALGVIKKVSKPVQFAATWVLLALVGATLSNRPYPHYFLQVIPPLALLLGGLWDQLAQVIKPHPDTQHQHQAGTAVGISAVAAALSLAVLLLLDFGLYPTARYYQDFAKLASGKYSVAEYHGRFNYLMDDNYQAAQIISNSAEPEMFIWGTNPMLYALTGTEPTGRFTVSFHIKDFAAYEETLADLIHKAPLFIVVMKNETDPFPEFYEFLESSYIPNQNFMHFTLWKKQLPEST